MFSSWNFVHETVIKKFWTRVLKLTLNLLQSVPKKTAGIIPPAEWELYFCDIQWSWCCHYLQVLINFSFARLITIDTSREGEEEERGDEIDIFRLCCYTKAKYSISYVTKWNIQSITLHYLLEPSKTNVMLLGYRRILYSREHRNTEIIVLDLSFFLFYSSFWGHRTF